jgi:Na+-transporting methylmalonyl-CoA/oxaloacetate decarboxylase gamma subunit
MIAKFLTVWRSLPLPQQTAAVLVVLFVLVIVLLLPTALVSHFKDRKFDRQIEALKTERKRETDRANQAEARAVKLEAEKLKHELILEVAGERAKVAMQKVTNAEKQFVLDSDHINGIADICLRYAELRASLNLAPKECPAE